MERNICFLNRVGVEIPKIEVRFEHLSIEGDAYVGTRALPTLLNFTMNFIEVVCSVCPFVFLLLFSMVILDFPFQQIVMNDFNLLIMFLGEVCFNSVDCWNL